MEQMEIVQKAVKRIVPDFSAMGFLVALAIAQLFYYINFQGDGFSRDVALAYIIIPWVLLAAYSTECQQRGKKLNLDRFQVLRVVFHGFIGFMITWAFVLVVYGRLLGMSFGTVSVSELWGTVLTQVLFVACSEELAFRYIIPAYFKDKWPKARYLPLIAAAASFAVFHSAAYGGNYQAMGLAFIIGLVWLFLYNVKIGDQKLGLGFTIGSHAAYNLVLVGVLSGGITLIGGI